MYLIPVQNPPEKISKDKYYLNSSVCSLNTESTEVHHFLLENLQRIFLEISSPLDTYYVPKNLKTAQWYPKKSLSPDLSL